MSYFTPYALGLFIFVIVWGVFVSLTLKKIYRNPRAPDELQVSVRNEIGFRMKGIYLTSIAIVAMAINFLPDFFSTKTGSQCISLALWAIIFVLMFVEQIMKRLVLNRYLKG